VLAALLADLGEISERSDGDGCLARRAVVLQLLAEEVEQQLEDAALGCRGRSRSRSGSDSGRLCHKHVDQSEQVAFQREGGLGRHLRVLMAAGGQQAAQHLHHLRLLHHPLSEERGVTTHQSQSS
jgi:hypothetical protein